MAPAGAPRRLARLDSLKKSALGRRPPGPTVKQACCDDPKVEEEDGNKVCKNCFTQISESNIVSDITFSEDARGAATVQGGYISENARHARTLGSSAFRRVGGEKNSIEEIQANGRRELQSLCPRLGIPENVSNQAASIWSLAAKQNFTAGRRTDEVIGACLYAACRRQKENTILLMDISEQQKINVFRLGEVYKDLCKDLFLDNENQLGFQRLVEIEPLILKYCRNLEFGDMTRQVAEDAVKIIRRMKRDWITPGRHPAGLCGGAIILAARMNNFRRTVREIVYVSKVADITVAKRVEEFRRTRSAALTVDQFRSYGAQLKDQHDPPSVYLADQKQQKIDARKRKRQEHHARRESQASSPVSTPASTPASTPGPSEDAQEEPTAKRPRIDADGFAIPALPSEASQSDTASGRGKKKTKKELNRPEPIAHISEEELADEQELELEIEEVLENPKLIDSRNDIERAKSDERARLLAEEQRAVDAERIKARRNAQGITWFDREVVPDVEDLEAEFENDPEVINCRLSEDEVKAKEKIWVAFNEDWLRTQHEKELMAKINAASGRKEPIKKTNANRKRRSKMGDGSVLAEAGTPIETPADANAAMLAKRAPLAFSRHVNYEALMKVYGKTNRAASETPTAASSVSRDASPESSATDQQARATTTANKRAAPAMRNAQAPTPPQTQGADGEEDEAVEEAEEEDEDDNAHDYNDDYDDDSAPYYEGDEDEDYERTLEPYGDAALGGFDNDDGYGNY